MNIILTPANWDDWEPAMALNEGADGGITVADLGYRGPDRADTLAVEAEMLLIIREDAPEHKFMLSQVRQGVETMFSQW